MIQGIDVVGAQDKVQGCTVQGIDAMLANHDSPAAGSTAGWMSWTGSLVAGCPECLRSRKVLMRSLISTYPAETRSHNSRRTDVPRVPHVANAGFSHHLPVHRVGRELMNVA